MAGRTRGRPPTPARAGGTRLDLGRLEVWLLRLSESHPSMLEAPAVQSAWDVFDAADAWAEALPTEA